jgi:hypothetical protein
MSLAADFPQETAQSVSIQAVSSTGLYGPTYSAAVTYACHVKEQVKNIIDKNGTAAVSSLQIYLDGWPSVGYDSKITYGGANPPIKLIAKEPDEEGGAYATIVYT